MAWDKWPKKKGRNKIEQGTYTDFQFIQILKNENWIHFPNSVKIIKGNLLTSLFVSKITSLSRVRNVKFQSYLKSWSLFLHFFWGPRNCPWGLDSRPHVPSCGQIRMLCLRVVFIQERKPSLDMQADSIHAAFLLRNLLDNKASTNTIKFNLFKVQLFKQLWNLYFFTLDNDVWYIETLNN